MRQTEQGRHQKIVSEKTKQNMSDQIKTLAEKLDTQDKKIESLTEAVTKLQEALKEIIKELATWTEARDDYLDADNLKDYVYDVVEEVVDGNDDEASLASTDSFESVPKATTKQVFDQPEDSAE